MNLQPLVSIVTPVYNEAQHLAECIESVLAQTYQNWDYTIIDNCPKGTAPDLGVQPPSEPFCTRRGLWTTRLKSLMGRSPGSNPNLIIKDLYVIEYAGNIM
jgi:cellulose synthase/poly-beta-1,6-N-acetylglucosamine synthase-like glycosyltransferase